MTASWKTKAYKNKFGFEHYGVDMVSAAGDKTLWASGSGTVVSVGSDNVVGNVVAICYPNAFNHKSGETRDVVFRYFHLASIAVKPGQSVTKDTRIGQYGNTGTVGTGAHLHIEADTDTAHPLYSPTVNSSSFLSGRIMGANDKTMTSPLDWLHRKADAPDNQTYMTVADAFIAAGDKTIPVHTDTPVSPAKTVILSPENRPAPHGIYAGYSGVYEHDVMCEIADITKSLLKAVGITVYIPPRDMPLEQRKAWANSHDTAALIAFHSNGADGKARGLEVMYSDTLAAFPAHIAASKRLSKALHKEILSVYQGADRGIRKDYRRFGEIMRVNAPSAYIEFAFHDNADDARFIVEGKQRLAEAVCKAVCGFMGVELKKPETPSTDELSALRAKISALENQVSELSKKLQKIHEITEG